MINKKFEKLFGMISRDMASTYIDQFYMDIAASIQKVLEFSILKICSSIRDEYNLKNLCMAGGVALNCVANGKILKKKYLTIFGYNQRQEMLEVLLAQLYMFGTIWQIKKMNIKKKIKKS